MVPNMSDILWTIGHSNRDWDAFVSLLQENAIERIADVRRFPGSRRYPHFGRDAMAAALQEMGIDYRHFPELGGRRGKPAADSSNTGWRVEAFNAYADYMATNDFSKALLELMEDARRQRTAVMCSEALPWRCHRRLIADALLVAGWSVLDIVGPRKVTPHALTPFARISGSHLTYPGEPLFTEE